MALTTEDPLKSHESTKRVLFHLVNCYQTWRDLAPNEFTDDAVRIGEQHLREVDWFPPDGGWFANGTDTAPSYETRPTDNVLTLIDNELKRLRGSPPDGRGRWRQGVLDARQAAAHELQKIRDAYVVESLSRETEDLRLYGIQEKSDDV
jgi:hypothetical protein